MPNVNKYQTLAYFGRELLKKRSLEEGLPMIAHYVKDVIGTDRCSIFMYDARKQECWTILADGVKKITIPSDKGIVGHTLKEKKTIIVNDAYSHPCFLSNVDKESGYVTNNLITTPVFNSKREILGILELLNKKDDFSDEDVKFMIFFAHFISGFLELTKSYMKNK